MFRLVIAGLVLAAGAWAQTSLVTEVRTLLRDGKRAEAMALLESAKKSGGVTSDYLLARSWVARDAFARSRAELDDAYNTAKQVEADVLASLQGGPVDRDKQTPLALGAAIEVQAQALAKSGQRSEAVALLQDSLKKYGTTSMKARLYKNLNMLTMEGKPALPYSTSMTMGPKALPLAAYRGRPLVLFFWAHWCGDCRAEAPVLGEFQKQHPEAALVGVTQRYGYAEGGADATPEQELKWIEKVRQEFYVPYGSIAMVVDDATFKRYGASTTPTMVMVDRQGMVRLYHPGNLSLDELNAAYKKL